MSKRERPGYPRVGEWPLDDEIVALRLFGTDQIYELASGAGVQTVGSSPTCDLVLRNQGGTVAARHARLVRRHERWLIQAVADAPVLRDLVALREFPLIPGIEVKVGDRTLIAESERSRALHRLLTRVVGFGPEQRGNVDRTLHRVLIAASGRRALMLCGEGDLTHVARQIHERTLADQPFVVCDPRRAPNAGSGHKPRSIANPMHALAAAAGGTLCLHAQRLPQGFQRIVQRWRGSETRVHLVLCTSASARVLETVADALVLVPLYLRWRDRVRIIHDVAAEAAIELGIAGAAVSDADRQIILACDATTLSELETVTRRLVAIRHWADLGRGGLTRAAEKLGIAHATLTEWAERRGLITVHHRKAVSRRPVRIVRSATARPRHA